MRKTYEYHTPVLLDEILTQFLHKNSGVFLDGTLGGGGHFWAMAERLDAGSIMIGIDRDPKAVAWNREHTRPCRPRLIIEHSCFSDLDAILGRNHIKALDGVFLDLGISSHQIDEASRGFSYLQDADLDMRMDPGRGFPAHELIARSSTAELAAVLRNYGEIQGAFRMAKSLKDWGERSPLRRSAQIREWYRRTFGRKAPNDLLARLFQALRIAVNDELGELERFLDNVLAFLNPEARLAVISYHSLEDRMVKEFMRDKEKTCICPPEMPVCRCAFKPLLKRLNKKAIRPSLREINHNRRARSARLRIAQRTGAAA
ncbi:MAG: 16S rRNA (cytosine(1402)-N(4))-methyltransferase RsmH [Chitinispirillaceae bacterium]|nr:16S rRNA (cytosine(1402)-N(4))-methyltransferase RsmH [Chitinispirillaceae bacterium]